MYDVTAFISKHPGGAGIIQVNAGQPCLEFEDIHSPHVHRLLKKYYIGELVEGEEGEEEEMGQKEAEGAEAAAALAPPTVGEEKGGEALPWPFLDPQAFHPCPLIEKEKVTHDTRRFRFGCVCGCVGAEKPEAHALLTSEIHTSNIHTTQPRPPQPAPGPAPRQPRLPTGGHRGRDGAAPLHPDER